jgi:pimeloyl-ACP methyl ester carboxylesterase
MRNLRKYLALIIAMTMIATALPVMASENWWETVDVDWQEGSVQLDTGINMSYLTSGNPLGKPVILIHGATDSRLTWAQIVPELQNYRLYIVELRGHGKSDKPDPGEGGYTVEQHAADIISFMNAKYIWKANMVGHSLGSLVAQNLAIDYPWRVRSISLLATAASTVGNPVLDWVVNGDGETYLGLYGYDQEGALPDQFIQDWTFTTNEDEDFGRGIYLHAKALPYLSWRYIFNGISSFDNTARLDQITCPVLIIWGTEDVLFTEADQQAMLNGLTNASVQYVEIENASHNVHWDSVAIAEQVADTIDDFIPCWFCCGN